MEAVTEGSKTEHNFCLHNWAQLDKGLSSFILQIVFKNIAKNTIQK